MINPQDENHMVLPSADDDQVVCTCEDRVREHCPLHPRRDTWEPYDESRQQEIDNQLEKTK